MHRKPTRVSMLTLVAAGVLAALPTVATAQTAAAPQRQGETREVQLRELPTESESRMAELQDIVGKPVADFTLTDTEGNTHTLSDYLNDGKIVVIEWFNSTCPYVVRHYDRETTMNDLVAKYEEKGVVWLAIATGKTADAGANQKARENWDMAHPVLLDPSGDVGRAFGSKNTPTMYVINTDGILAYGGAIDDNTSGSNPNPTNHVEAAVDALLEGSNVTTTYTKAYGCSVKYSRR